MRISSKGLDLIKSFEGCKLTAYRDIVGVLTIGYGHTGVDVRDGMAITAMEADALLHKDLARFEDGVTAAVKVPVSQGQFDALVAFSFNLGLGRLLGSTLLKKLNSGDPSAAADEFLKWSRAGGKEVAGLVRRRQAERSLFLS